MKEKTTRRRRPDQTGAPAADARPDQRGSVSELETKTPNAQDAPAALDAQNADPELNPISPEFNASKYREMLSSLDIESIEHRIKKAVSQADNAAEAAAAEITQSGIVPQAVLDGAVTSLQEILEIAKWAKEAAQDMLTPELRRLFDMRGTLEGVNWKAFIAAVQEGEERIKALEPFLEAELPAIRKQPGYESAELEDIETFIGIDGRTIAEEIGGQPIPPFIRDAINRAAAAAYKANHPTATAKRAVNVEFPLDKMNSTVWNGLQETTGGQLRLWPIKVERDGSEKELTLTYGIDFATLETAGVKVTQSLLPFDKRVYIAISALYNAGNNVISLTQIYYAMGNVSKKPAVDQIQRIQDSITKMTGARVYVDNTEETTVYKYPRFKYDGPLLPIERATAIINGQIADAAIHIFREPPVMTFAKQRRQITTITVKALQSPISKTNGNLLIDDYLLERIAHAKNGRQPKKILYSKLYEAAQIKTPKQKQRAPEKIKTYLEHYKACGMISGYALLKDGIQLEF